MAENPYDLFSTKTNYTTDSTVHWETVATKDVQKTCEATSRKYGLNGYGFALDACSFQYKKNGQHVCHVITANNVNMWTVGHEIRHCFQGAYHK